MDPNYNFENEVSNQYNLKNYEFRYMAKELLSKHKVIDKKEYDIIMWIGCNMSSSSIVRDLLFKGLKGIQKLENSKKINNFQNKLKL